MVHERDAVVVQDQENVNRDALGYRMLSLPKLALTKISEFSPTSNPEPAETHSASGFVVTTAVLLATTDPLYTIEIAKVKLEFEVRV